MFVNYLSSDKRDSPLNIAVCRFVLGGWLVWKTIWYDWSRFVDTPYRAFLHPAYEWAIPVSVPWLLTVEKWVLIALALLFIVGYRIRITGAIITLLVAHLATVRYTLQQSGETTSLFVGMMLILFFALYAEYDRLSIDELRRTSDVSTETLVERLQDSGGRQYAMPQLKFVLLVVATIYFGSGVDKILSSQGFGFATTENLARIITIYSPVIPAVESLFLNHTILVLVGAWGTLVLEIGFLLATIAGVSITPFAVGLVGFTLINLAVLGLFFVDGLFFITTLAAHDRILSRLGLDRELDLIFDENCQSCLRALLIYKYIDVNDTVKFYTQQEAAETDPVYEDVQFDGAVMVFHDGAAYEGYYALRELLRQYRVFYPIGRLLGLPLLRTKVFD